MTTPRISRKVSDELPVTTIGTFDCAMVESAAAIEFLDLKDTRTHDQLCDFEQGVAFRVDAELRWRRRGDEWHLVLISDTGEILPDAAEDKALFLSEIQEPARFILLGKRSGEEFIEGSIPGALLYPAVQPAVAEGQRLAVRLKHYETVSSDSAAGRYEDDISRVTRCVKLVAAERVKQ